MNYAVIGRHILGAIIAGIGLILLEVNLSDLPLWKSVFGLIAFFMGAEIMSESKWQPKK